MVMPVTVLVKETNGKEHKVDLPVEVWQRGGEWTFRVNTTSRITDVILDPDRKLPDVDRKNNTADKRSF
jgi:predicted Rdx family selenoprotein